MIQVTRGEIFHTYKIPVQEGDCTITFPVVLGDADRQAMKGLMTAIIRKHLSEDGGLQAAMRAQYAQMGPMSPQGRCTIPGCLCGTTQGRVSYGGIQIPAKG